MTEEQLEELVTSLINQLTLAEKIGFLSTKQSGVSRLQIGDYEVGGEAAHGVVVREGTPTTSFSIPLGLSQTWNPELLKEVGNVIGTEARILYNQSGKRSWLTLWAPTIDMERDPRWGRNEEAYGEDPYLTGRLSVGLIKGMQGEGPYVKMVAAPKHFFGNNNEIGREDQSNTIHPRIKHEYYLKAFKPAFVEGRAQSMMTAYNGVNGIPCMQIEEINDIVKGAWQMDGFVVSDGGALTLNVEAYKYHGRFAEALADSLKHGVDCFVDEKELVEEAAWLAYRQGLISEEDVTEAVRRILRVRARMGQFSPSPYDQVDETLLAGQTHGELSQQVALEQVVLLKNQHLPLNSQARILVTGPLANRLPRDWYGGISPYGKTIYQGLRDEGLEQVLLVDSDSQGYFKLADGRYLSIKNGQLIASEDKSLFTLERWGAGSYLIKDSDSSRYLRYTDNASFNLHQSEVYDWFIKEKWLSQDEITWQTWDGQEITVLADGQVVAGKGPGTELIFECHYQGIQEAAAISETVDQTIIVVGNHPLINGKEQEDRPSMALPEYQQELIRQVMKKGGEVLLVIVGSYPFELGELANIPTIIFSAHGGQELGSAISQIIYGRVAPTGKLSQTWYQEEGLLPEISEYDISRTGMTYQYAQSNVLYPFGYGLTFGELGLKSLSSDQERWQEGEAIDIELVLENTAGHPITETVQLYLKVEGEDKLRRPLKSLVGFRKVTVAPYSELKIRLVVEAEAAHYWDVAWNRWVFPSGKGIISAGFSSETVRETTLSLEGRIRQGRPLSSLRDPANFDEYHQIALTVNKFKEKGVLLEAGGRVEYFAVEAVKGDEMMIELEAVELTELVVSWGQHRQSQQVSGPSSIIWQAPMTGKETFSLTSNQPVFIKTMKGG
ncbi:glycoside hydrolase family 3 C-terminal domain-containing protein [Vagococcus sp. BWB3-3]|uniref:Glycoside hydrolase family 3 C-terminal domain-containing protein n=1 Tax=Vagococcus allomyrinae TaxID=2794353 RepID=A0A940STY8_9ENTE|nr:glycoside hydrolase family 3 C-terminal domain-containing protein [Vagococcus allomyrinae]MBP1039551.1 glycoside hydrolase family 3 C-terminal domain-containing protein [Vagococcus allomyrinae]